MGGSVSKSLLAAAFISDFLSGCNYVKSRAWFVSDLGGNAGKSFLMKWLKCIDMPWFIYSMPWVIIMEI